VKKRLTNVWKTKLKTQRKLREKRGMVKGNFTATRGGKEIVEPYWHNRKNVPVESTRGGGPGKNGTA